MSEISFVECGDCIFWESHKDDDEIELSIGDCKRHAPTPRYREPKNKPNTEWPFTWCSDGCGDGGKKCGLNEEKAMKLFDEASVIKAKISMLKEKKNIISSIIDSWDSADSSKFKCYHVDDKKFTHPIPCTITMAKGEIK